MWLVADSSRLVAYILPLLRKKKKEKAARPQGALGPGSEALNRDEAEEILKESLEAMLPNRMVWSLVAYVDV